MFLSVSADLTSTLVCLHAIGLLQNRRTPQATVESALTNGDLTALLDDKVYQDCDAVADAIGAAQITAQCP